MNRIIEIIARLDGHQDLAYSLIRAFLGIALFVRGWILFANPETITLFAAAENLHMWFSYITIAHLAGGLLLAVGLLTRVAALVQIPILIGAVFIVHTEQNLMTVGQSLELAVLVLVLLIVFTIFGSGSFSLRKYLFKKKEGNSEEPYMSAEG